MTLWRSNRRCLTNLSCLISVGPSTFRIGHVPRSSILNSVIHSLEPFSHLSVSRIWRSEAQAAVWRVISPLREFPPFSVRSRTHGGWWIFMSMYTTKSNTRRIKPTRLAANLGMHHIDPNEEVSLLTMMVQYTISQSTRQPERNI